MGRFSQRATKHCPPLVCRRGKPLLRRGEPGERSAHHAQPCTRQERSSLDLVRRCSIDMNWERLKQQLLPGAGAGNHKKRKRQAASQEPKAALSASASKHSALAAPAPAIPDAPQLVSEALTPRLAVDCEMVGVGPRGKRSALARVVIVGFDERIVYSSFVQPQEPITDFRTFVSGVKPQSMKHALPLRRVQADVAALIKDRTLIGHALANDLKALMLTHPKDLTRDTSHYPPYREQMGEGSRPRGLRWLAKDFLGWDIQAGAHSPAEDAVAALRLYKLKMSEWERSINKSGGGARGKAHGDLGSESAGAHQTSKWERALAKGKQIGRRTGIQKPRKVKRGTS